MARKTPAKRGDRYGSLVLIKEVKPYSFPSGQKQRQFLCRCDCGVEKKIVFNRLKTGNTTTCGCSRIKHRLRKHSLYYVWSLMKQRCSNKKYKSYKYYGGRGVKVCKAWQSDFMAFYDDMSAGYKKGLHLDRIDHNGDYSPSNCRWVSCTVNNRNRRSTKLSFDKAKQIRSLVKSGVSRRQVASSFGISVSNVGMVVTNKTWKSK